jgi:hypothetical protein
VKRSFLTAFFHRRLSPRGYLGLHLTVGVLVLIVSCWAFAEITQDVMTGAPSLQFDHTAANFFHARATPAMIDAMTIVSFFGSGGFVTPAGSIIAFYLAWRRKWYWLLMLLLAVPGGAVLNVAVKQVIHRERPVFENPIATLESFSFPPAVTP